MISLFRAAFVLGALVPSACVLDARSDSFQPFDDADEADTVCPSRYGGEADHVLGDRWFFSDELCRCVDVAGEPVTDCVYTCDQRGVRFMDSVGVVCTCDERNVVTCEADGNDANCACLCSDPDDDGVCDDG